MYVPGGTVTDHVPSSALTSLSATEEPSLAVPVTTIVTPRETRLAAARVAAGLAVHRAGHGGPGLQQKASLLAGREGERARRSPAPGRDRGLERPPLARV
ncbi:MAG: hypothetical protein ACLP01_06090 [Solirubrobacteraceae bacterium]